MKTRHVSMLIVMASVVIVTGGCGPTSSKNNTTTADGAMQDARPVDAATSDPNVDDDGDGYTERQGDCDDSNPEVHPTAQEVCDDGIDNDCDGNTDGDQPDADGDGWGPCRGDCNDSDPAVHPGQDEIASNGKDDDCDGIVDADFDGDGYTVADGDCDDASPLVNPGMAENCYDGIDNDCDGNTDSDQPDLDGDGFGPCSGDCDDTDPNIHPGQPEIAGDGIDNNCDFLVDEDIDGDGWTEANGDCDDNDPTVNPAALEDCTDGIDNNCDGDTDQNCLDPCTMAAATASYLGCEFYAVDLPQYGLTKDYAIVVSNPSENQAANVVITTVSGQVASFAVSPLTLHVYSVTGQSQRTQNVSGSGLFHKAYRITSDLPVAVYQFNSLTTVHAASTDASLLFASHNLAKRYYVMDYDGFQGSSSFAAIYATQPNTHVTVYPTVTSSTPTTATMQPYDVFVVTATNAGQSLTGTRVESDQPIGIFGGNACTQVPYGTSYCDHLEQQIFPRQAIGTTYIVAKSHARTYCNVPDRIRILSDTDGNQIHFDPAITAPITLNAGQWQELSLDQSVAITATNPVLVGQFLRSSGGSQCHDEGDPAFILQVPIDQYRTDYVFLIPDTYDHDYADIVAPLGTTVTLDGVPVSISSTALGTTGSSITSITMTDGVHHLTATQPVGVVVYGYGGPPEQNGSTVQNVSYGYPAGLNLSIINPIE